MNFLQNYHSGYQLDNDVYKPEFYRVKNTEDRRRLEELLQNNNRIAIFDEIEGQLRELLKSKNPTIKIKADEYPHFIERHLNGCDIREYGVWVYYPWSHRLVHILDEEEFIYLRTAANRHKITEEERDVLATKKVGVIGLSVGQSVSLTLAMERACGELRLADFDTLELNNLNRIRTGLHNLGLRKVVSVAREIAEIDPFFKTVLYPEGITEENIHGFFTDGGKLDLVIDECDGVDVKILCRIKAKELQVPVVMEASDRGTVDVERFDLEPGRSIIHGWLDHLELDFNVLKKLKTAEEKLPYILPISGLETLSPRMKASMMEIEQSITTWPQLASAVTLGGAITTDVCRRIFLDQYHDSGRYFIDIEKLICDKEPAKNDEALIPVFYPGISKQDMDSIIAGLNLDAIEEQVSPDDEVVKQMVDAALQAPTGGNSQPWKWRYKNGAVYLFRNAEYITALVDFQGTGSMIGFGAATENLVLKAHELGFDVKLDREPSDNKDLIAVFRFTKKQQPGLEPHAFDEVVTAIPHRFSNRIINERRPIDNTELAALQKVAASVPGASLQFVTEDDKIAAVADVMAKADRMRLMHKGGHLDFSLELVWPENTKGDITRGLDIDTIDLTPSERVGFKIASDWTVINYLNKWNKGTGLERVTRKAALGASAIGLITMPSFDHSHFFDGGRALERVWLAATKAGISFQPISISLFLFNRMMYEGIDAFPARMAEELMRSRKVYEDAFGIDKKQGEIFMFKLFYTDKTIKRSLRMPLEEVLVLD
ncbi:MAG: Rv1355c family protein [Bacteroidetes bacterium]|nr:Rv1355c family protein [Bacteroidota bacterium]